MVKPSLIIYVSNHCETSSQLINYLNEHQIAYQLKNVTENKSYLTELQEKGIYGTPATYFNDKNQFILGFQKTKMNFLLGKG